MKRFLSTVALTSILVTSLAACSHVHNFDEWEAVKASTCTEEGIKERYCSCGEKQTANIILNGHNYVNGVCTTCGHGNAGVAPDEDGSTNNDDEIQISAEEQKYNEALALLEAADYVSAHELFKELGDYKDSKIYLSRFHNVITSFSEVGGTAVICTYNDKNLPEEQLVSDAEYFEKFTFSYDDNGNLIKLFGINSDGYSESYTHTYNENNDLIKTENVRSNGYSRTYDYTYAENGDLIKEVGTSSDGYNYTYDYTYYYDENENFVTERINTDSDGRHDKYIEIYNKKDNLIKYIYISSSGYKITYDYTYRYDEKGNLIARCKADEYGNTRIEYYDEYGNCIKYVYVDSDGDETIDDYSGDYIYYYDEHGNLIKMAENRENGYSIVYNYKLVYIPYDISQTVIDVLNFSHIGS